MDFNLVGQRVEIGLQQVYVPQPQPLEKDAAADAAAAKRRKKRKKKKKRKRAERRQQQSPATILVVEEEEDVAAAPVVVAVVARHDVSLKRPATDKDMMRKWLSNLGWENKGIPNLGDHEPRHLIYEQSESCFVHNVLLRFTVDELNACPGDLPLYSISPLRNCKSIPNFHYMVICCGVNGTGRLRADIFSTDCCKTMRKSALSGTNNQALLLKILEEEFDMVQTQEEPGDQTIPMELEELEVEDPPLTRALTPPPSPAIPMAHSMSRSNMSKSMPFLLMSWPDITMPLLQLDADLAEHMGGNDDDIF